MKKAIEKPTLEEVKEYFKDAESVKCTNDSGKYYLDFSKDIELYSDSIRLLEQKDEPYSGTDTFCQLWSKRKGYAKILTYKKACRIETEPEYVITHNFPKGKDVCCNVVLSIKDIKEVLKLCFKHGVEIHDNLIEKGFGRRYLCHGESIGIDKLCTCDSDHFTTFDENVFAVSFEEFKAFIRGEGIVPDAFKEDKVELEVGKWYVYPAEPKFITYVKENGRRYGIGSSGNWFHDSDIVGDTRGYRLATPEEVTEALTKEAVKRGYVEGCYLIYPWLNNGEILKPKFNRTTKIYENGFLFKGTQVFREGIWAEIMPIISKEDAEKELGKKILN